MYMRKINPTKTQAWQRLEQHYQEIKEVKLAQLFNNDANRFSRFSIRFEDILIDFSKNRISDDTIKLLVDLAQETGLTENKAAFFSGQAINETENRAVMHTALRKFDQEPIFIDGQNILPAIEKVRHKMKKFADTYIQCGFKGYSGKTLNTIVNIGIGGSDLGPVMVTEALKPYWIKGINTYFVSNVDGSHWAEVSKKINPENTLFIVASKTFTTQETMTNAQSAKQWLLNYTNDPDAVSKHFIALSTNRQKVVEFGINPENIFEFWDWVGGRYSLWSSIGLSIACTIGYDNFERLLQGAAAMDAHFRDEPFEKNIPVIMGLLGIWNSNFLKAESHALLPYDQYLHRFAAYLQQADMESNGKSTDRNGNPVNYQTGPVIWGEPGTNGQHAFYQLIHQGTKLIPADFIAPAVTHNNIGQHHNLLLSNFFAQTQALMYGKSKNEVCDEMQKQGFSIEEIEKISPFRVFEGNIPTNSILVKQITPYNLGVLIALYEHKIFVQGAIWNIFSFDQWGVELGKQLANKILPFLINNSPVTEFDSSTNGLINQFKHWKKESTA